MKEIGHNLSKQIIDFVFRKSLDQQQTQLFVLITGQYSEKSRLKQQLKLTQNKTENNLISVVKSVLSVVGHNRDAATQFKAFNLSA